MTEGTAEVRVDWRVAIGVTLGLILLFTAQTYVAPNAMRTGASLARMFQLQVVVWGVWLALTPGIIGVARRWRRRGDFSPSAFAVQLVWAFAFSIMHAVIAGTWRWIAGISAYTDLVDVLIASVITTVGQNVPRYAFIAAAYHAVAYHHEVRDRDVRAARLEGALVQAKLDSLQGRLHPHFLFNTLNSIGALIHDQPAAAEQMLGSLSELLRASLHADPEREVTLERELDLVKQYVSIQRVRFNDRLNVAIDVPPSALQAQVPHLLLQPFVENAIRHGIAPREAPGHVRIAAGVTGGRLRLIVEDDGLGLSGGRADTAGSGFGLQGTRARLQHLYGASAAVDLQPRTPTGVTATIDLPYHTTPVSSSPAAV